MLISIQSFVDAVTQLIICKKARGSPVRQECAESRAKWWEGKQGTAILAKKSSLEQLKNKVGAKLDKCRFLEISKRKKKNYEDRTAVT